MNPYSDATFFEWFGIVLQRIFYLCGERSTSLVSDEIQLLVLICFSQASSFLGSFLFLKRQTMMANALSHTTLVGLVIAYLVSIGRPGEDMIGHIIPQGALFVGALCTTFLTIGLVSVLSTSRYMNQDAANGMVFTFLFALGVTILSLVCKNAQVGTDMIMGSIDMLRVEDISYVFWISFGASLLCGLFFRGFVVSIFDPVFGKCSNLHPVFFDRLLLFLSAYTIISSFRAVGLVLVLVFFVTPALTARLITNKLKTMLFVAQAIALFACIIGIALSRHILTVCSFAVSTSALIATLLVLHYLLQVVFHLYRRSKQKKACCVIIHRNT